MAMHEFDALSSGTAPSDAEYDAAMQGIDFQGGSAPLLVNPLFSSGGECSAQVILSRRLESGVVPANQTKGGGL